MTPVRVPRNALRQLLVVVLVAVSPLSSQAQSQVNCGSAQTCLGLGNKYRDGDGVPKDLDRAAELYDRACKGGLTDACDNLDNLGLHYAEGAGVQEDESHAVALYEEACDGGNLWGCTHLGDSFARGKGVRKDGARAVALLQRACDGGLAAGCSNLGLLYQYGQGVEKDEDQAIRFFQRACRRGERTGCSMLESVAGEWTGGFQQEMLQTLAERTSHSLSIAQAADAIRQGLLSADRRDVGSEPIREIQVTRSSLSYLDRSERCVFRFRTLKYIWPDRRTRGLGPQWHLSPTLQCGFEPQWQSSQEDALRRFVDAINFLIYQNSPQRDATDSVALEQFRPTARAWQQSGGQATLPEEARNERVLAENAFQEKSFDRALEHYENALTIYPTWPEGHFNAALIAADLQDYSAAVRHMRYYLVLAPNASDAQAAHDKILIWKDKLSRN
jgi:tetratricopeptide (TPR) repeat protein